MAKIIPFEEFDPNNLPDSIWATYVPARRKGGAFKLHSARGYALNAFTSESKAKLYEFCAGRWHERAVFDVKRAKQVHANCEVCRKPFDNESYAQAHYRYLYRDRLYQRLDRINGKVAWPLAVKTVCGECVAVLGL